MNTPSHFIMTAALDKGLPRVPIVRNAFLLGSIAPDLPLWLLSIGGIVYYHFYLGWSAADAFRLMFGQLYFHHPVWISSYNLLHSPLLLITSLALVWSKRRNIGSRSRWLFWFLLACLFHTGVDILTHVEDGPLLFFPLDWATRFHSPVSYWDPRHYGREFHWFELALDSVLLIYLLRRALCRQFRRYKVKHSPE
jgi:membrane-bound metal-dependent hydrolase YbcI (DUF457 family)